MEKEIVFYHWPSKDAQIVSEGMESRLGIDINLTQPGNHLNPAKKIIIFNGDGYMHHLTRSIFKELIDGRKAQGLPPISYVHIDGHDDMAAMKDGDDTSYKSFVLGIIEDNNGGVYFLEEGLTGERKSEVNFLTPILQPLNWKPYTGKLRDRDIYISIDLDVLDANAGIRHLFPQTPIGFDVDRLVEILQELGSKYNIVGADITGFSAQETTEGTITESLSNIARITSTLMEILNKS